MPNTQLPARLPDRDQVRRELVSRARSLAPRIAARAEDAERNRRIHDETIAEIAEARLFEILVPHHWGGHGLGIADMVAVLKELSPHCVSTGWVSGFYMIHNWMWCLMSKEAQAEIFADGPSRLGPVMVAPSVRAVPVPGGYRINGSAKWGTGSAHASWCMVSRIVDSAEPSVDPAAKPSPPVVLMFAMPWRAARLEDTWHTSGMAATASHDVFFDNIFIPQHRTFDAGPARSGEGDRQFSSPVYRTGFTPALCLAALTPLVAGTLGAVSHAVARAGSFLSTYSGKSSADNPAAQIRLGKASLMAESASILIDQLARDVEHDSQHPPIDIKSRAAQRARASYIATLCRDTVTLLAHGAGASGHMSDSPIQRAYRDISMAACHVVFDHDPTMELHGKMLLGRPPAMILA